ncbi:MarR family winged helix-turn-helix transcriptional regulator [Ramlibacter sp. MAHUQ-53]|uniref:MarR family winged helix-turn-helix transcriptional regulator n=1 Tax=unclassified Ramlibacter TaxID=2617605 RepID=UPI0036347DFB
MAPRDTARDAAREAAREAAADSLARKLTYRMHLLHKLTDQESQRRYLEEAGLSLSDGRCLSTIGAFEPISVNALAQMANLNKAQASRAAQALVDQGLVDKAGSASDGRGVQLTLTARGRKAWTRVMELIDRRNEEIFGCLSAQERQVLSDLFDRLIDNARGAAADPEA